MLKNMCLVLPLLAIPSAALATTCPSGDQLTHSKNQKWVLHPSYDHAGWHITSTLPADRGELKQLPADTKLTIWLYPQNRYPLKVSCMYELGYQAAVIVTHDRAFDPAGVPVPPFTASPSSGIDGYYCVTTAGSPGACGWN